ncbi:hypothetical protein [Spelaeicoccus albus]|uniref:F5/8 type C domain-containing protein n=1 Tax=Spelaeicoccus albus TaxID=1280376 RepID=A0A7Z0D189_9MICO|nr:hypothetical protein [Spelaeicoccus albus]NYI66578.1 hypothetical protein [Spelaeicoccus albus]
MVALSGVTQGAVIGNRYKVSSRPAEWIADSPAPGTTCLADDEILGRQVMLFAIAGGSGPDLLDAARRAALLADERVPRILDVGVDGDLVYVITEHPDTFPLSELLRSGPLRPDQARAVIGEASEALAAADARGLHHTRLTPSMLGIDGSGGVHLTGVAIDVAAAGSEVPGAGEASHADALGLVSLLYAALTARWPDTDGVDRLQPAETRGGAIAPPAEVVSGVPNDLDSLAAAVFSGNDDGPRTPKEVSKYLGPWEKSALSALGDRVDRAKYAKAKAVSALSGGLRPRASYPGAEQSRPGADQAGRAGASTTESPAATASGPASANRAADESNAAGATPPASNTGGSAGLAGGAAAGAAAGAAGAAAAGAARTHGAKRSDAESDAQSDAHRSRRAHSNRQGSTGASAGKPSTNDTDKLDPEIREAIAMRGASRFPLAGNAVLPSPGHDPEPPAERRQPSAPTSSPHEAADKAANTGGRHGDEPADQPEARQQLPAKDQPAEDQPTTVIPPVAGATSPAPSEPAGSPGSEASPQQPDRGESGYHRGTAQFPVVTERRDNRDHGTDERAAAGTAAGAGAAAGTGAAASQHPPRSPRRTQAAGATLSGRLGNRLAVIVIAAIVVVGLIIALTTLSSIGDDKTSAGAAPSPSESPSPSASGTPSTTPTTTPSKTSKPKPTPIKLTDATSLDPEGDGEEHNELAKNLIDGSASSAWISETYSTSKFGNLKSGVGFDITLDKKSTVHAVKLTAPAAGGDFEVRTSDDGKYDGSTEVGSGTTKDGVTTVKLKKPAKASHVVIWFTQLPRGSSGYRAEVSNIDIS